MVYFLVLSCETCPFVFSFCLPFSLKLSEAVTYADHEGMSFWGSSSVQFVCAPWLGGRASAVWSGRHCPVGGRLWPKEVKQEPWEHRAPPRFDGSLLPGLGPCWGVRSCSCTSQVVLVVKNPPANATDKKHGFNPWVRKIPWRRAWQPTLVFLENPMNREAHGLHTMGSQRDGHNWSGLACTHVCTLVTGWTGVWAVGATPLGLSHSLPSVHRGCTPQGWRSLCYNLPLCLQGVCTVTDALAGAISTRVLVSLPLQDVHQGMHWQWLPPPQSEVGPGSKLTLFPQSLHPFTGNGSPCFCGEKHQSRRGCNRSPVGTWGHWGDPGEPAGAAGSFWPAAFELWLEVSKYMCVLFSRAESLTVLQ